MFLQRTKVDVTCTVAGVRKYQGIAGTVKAMKAFQIIKENEPQYT